MGIRVDVSEKEAKASDIGDQLPVGKYHFAITDVELVESQSDNNYGKPMLNFEFTVQDTEGPWKKSAGRKDWINACLWSGATYTINMILKGIGKYDECVVGGSGETVEMDYPTEPEFYIGEQLIGRRGVDQKQKEKWPEMPERWVQLRGFSEYDETFDYNAGPSNLKSKGRARVPADDLLPG
jgi:hypothetical protein